MNYAIFAAQRAYEGLETFFTSEQQTWLFFLSCLFGVPIGIYYDVFRVLRVLIPHNKIMVALEDMIFMFSYAAFAMCFSVMFARGEFRFFYILGNLIGFTIYHFTIGNIVLGALRFICNKIYGFFGWLFKPLGRICEKFCNFFVIKIKSYKFIVKKKNNS